MEIWIKHEKEEMRLPVLPSSFEISTVQNNQTVNINSIGEINLIGKRGLITTSLSCFFPNPKNGYGNDIVEYINIKKPYKYVKSIQKWKKIGKCKLVITGVINLWCTIEGFTYSEQDGTGDVYYTIELKEYRNVKLKKAKKKNVKKKEQDTKQKEKKTATKQTSIINKNTTKITQPDTTRVSKTVTDTTYIVKKGDTLMGIAKKITGDSNNYAAIAKQNNMNNPNLIYAGQKLVIKA